VVFFSFTFELWYLSVDEQQQEGMGSFGARIFPTATMKKKFENL
jgi:hypothetical protein